VDPHDVGVLDTGPDPGLVLVTCWPFHYVGPAPERFIVQAELVATDDATTLASLAAPAVPVATVATARPKLRVAAAHAVRPARSRAHRTVAERVPVATHVGRRPVREFDAPRHRMRPSVAPDA